VRTGRTNRQARCGGQASLEGDPVLRDVAAHGRSMDDAPGGGDHSKIYYRVTTQDASGGNKRSSLTPSNGLWTVPPPYAVNTTTGDSDY
jgi:hypothetical protein